MKFASLGKQTAYAVFDARNGPGIIDSILRNQVAMTSDETVGWRPKTLKQVAAETAFSIPSAFNPQTAFMSLHAFLQEASDRPRLENPSATDHGQRRCV